MRYYLSPSLMCMDMMKLTKQLRFLNSKADRLHVDIMDGHYVKNLALSASFVAQIRPYTSLPIDVHLMVEAPASFIPALLDAGAQILVMGSSGLFRADMPLELAWETMSRELSAALHSPELV
ncbi:hypothetical protein ENZ43_15170 [Klebsiella pneumoniae]|uniref:hypothetical protein n=1 Tax=Klebsiella pneumoniae TaxID=573 RepID=UPI001038BD97|nr:hypothetical protein [Klebsiella pneumoniae]QBK43695.1 hypothetical protein ENZ43_15170 [Klebsiella pneumoniae]HED1343587.1 hypothetical protein [Klebsiella pneumoniae]